MPLCDGAHQTQAWSCSPDTDTVLPYLFVASPSLENLADRLAHRFKGSSMLVEGGRTRAERLVIVSDGHDLDRIRRVAGRVEAGETWLMPVGAPDGVLSWAFPSARVLRIASDAPALLWKSAEAAVLTPAGSGTDGDPGVSKPPRPSVFLSHAAADEAALFPIIEALRDHLGLRLFVCADSITPGAGWHDEIQDQLRASDLFVFANSEHARESMFCAFEAGMAVSLNKPMRVVGLDSSKLPTHLQHIQALSVGRLQRRKPWLGPVEARMEAFLTVVGQPLAAEALPSSL